MFICFRIRWLRDTHLLFSGHDCHDMDTTSGPRFNIKMSSYQYGKSHCGDKTVVRSSYLHNGISCTGKMSSLYWFGPLYLCPFVREIHLPRGARIFSDDLFNIAVADALNSKLPYNSLANGRCSNENCIHNQVVFGNCSSYQLRAHDNVIK